MERVADARLGTEADAALVAGLLIDFNAEYGEASPPLADLTERLARQVADGAAWVVIGLADGEPVGFATAFRRATAYTSGGAAYLEDLYVRPGRRGGGVGGAMVRKLHEHAMRHGVAMLEVSVDERDADALRFYARHGFGQREGTMGERAWHLERGLP